MRHVARAVAEEGDGEARELALVLADRQQIRQQLAGVEVVGQRVDDGHPGAGGHLLEPRLRVGAPDDRRHHPLEHARGVGGRLLASQLAVRGRDDERAAAEVGDADGEAHPGAGRRLVEDHRDGLRARERRAAPAVGLDQLGEVEDLGLLRRGEVVVAQEVAGHGVSPGSVCGISRASANLRVNSCNLVVADDEGRGEADAVLVRRVDDESRVERAAGDDAGDRLRESDAEQQAAALDVGDERRAEQLDAGAQLAAADAGVGRRGPPARSRRAPRSRRPRRAGCRRRSSRGGRDRRASTPRRRSPARRSGIRRRCPSRARRHPGTMPSCWKANQSPVRPAPVWISSRMSSAPYRVVSSRAAAR